MSTHIPPRVLARLRGEEMDDMIGAFRCCLCHRLRPLDDLELRRGPDDAICLTCYLAAQPASHGHI